MRKLSESRATIKARGIFGKDGAAWRERKQDGINWYVVGTRTWRRMRSFNAGYWSVTERGLSKDSFEDAFEDIARRDEVTRHNIARVNVGLRKLNAAMTRALNDALDERRMLS